ncbi:hypothetical protein FACS189447_10380 [Spirochaetia bacterium]|nr:hypothetical protein FACS189447_10380 [Spirochaetia bacterium]
MPMQQTIDIPAHPKGEVLRLTLEVPQDVPEGRCRIVFFPELPVPAKADPEESLPRVSRAQREERRKRRKDDPVWQVLDQPLEYDSSWLPEGLTLETFRVKDVRDIIIKDKYGL